VGGADAGAAGAAQPVSDGQGGGLACHQNRALLPGRSDPDGATAPTRLPMATSPVGDPGDNRPALVSGTARSVGRSRSAFRTSFVDAGPFWQPQRRRRGRRRLDGVDETDPLLIGRRWCSGGCRPSRRLGCSAAAGQAGSRGEPADAPAIPGRPESPDRICARCPHGGADQLIRGCGRDASSSSIRRQGVAGPDQSTT